MVSPAGLYLPIAVNLVTSHTPKQRPPCQPCEAVCAASASWVASTHLRGSEARCWGLCGPLSRSTVLPRGVSKAVQKESLEGGHITQPLNNFLLLHQAESPSICVRQNAQGKGRAEGSILKQDKAVTPPHFTPARSAGREYRGQNGFRLLRSVLRNLTWHHFEGVDILFGI